MCVCIEHVVVPVFTSTAVVRMEVTVCVCSVFTTMLMNMCVNRIPAMSASIDLWRNVSNAPGNCVQSWLLIQVLHRSND